MTGTPSRLPSSTCTSRATTSTGPPTGHPTRSLTGPSGYACAGIAAQSIIAPAKIPAASAFMEVPPAIHADRAAASSVAHCAASSQLFACNPRALYESLQFRPCHIGIDLRIGGAAHTKSAVDASDDVLASEDTSHPHKPVGDDARVLNDIRSGIDHTSDDLQTLRQLHRLPDT